MKENTKWYWEHNQKQQVIVVPTHNIVHTCIGVILVKYVHDIPKSICNRNQAGQDLKRHHICLTDSDHYSIID